MNPLTILPLESFMCTARVDDIARAWMGAVYRFNHYGWDYDQHIYAEMKKFDFYTRWGHGDLKKFVQDYAVTHHNKAAADCRRDRWHEEVATKRHKRTKPLKRKRRLR